ncbi:hypothetical protein [Streptomyces sp. NPDC053079]|uniref:hypothetical protein n=1 Tax=Streptomyces sp. NPDC053079 TaxID=3365697 RepID=UPI0037D9700C
MPIARLNALTCNSTEDNTGDDDITIKVFGSRYAEATRSMNTNQTWDINLDVPFSANSRVKIEVWERDLGWWLDPDDLLGVHFINASQADQGAKATEFNADGASYTLTYEVVGDTTRQKSSPAKPR